MKQTESYIKFPDFELYYQLLEKGSHSSEPVLIFLHDSWGCTEMWDDFPERWQMFSVQMRWFTTVEAWKIFAFRQRRTNENIWHEASDELIAVMDKLDIGQAVLYGHSDGGTIALIAAAMHPERFRGIIVEGAHSFVEEKGKNAVRESRDKAKTNMLLQVLERFHGEKTEELFRRWHEAWLSDFFTDWTIVPILKNITCPVLAFRGENDPFDTIEQLNVLERKIKSPIIAQVISNAEHTPRRENEPATMELIERFMGKLKAGSSL